MSPADLDATTVVADWLPIITARIVAVLIAVDAMADALNHNAGAEYVATLRHRAFQALVRLDEVVPGGIRDQLWPEFQIGFDRAIARAETA